MLQSEGHAKGEEQKAPPHSKYQQQTMELYERHRRWNPMCFSPGETGVKGCSWHCKERLYNSKGYAFSFRRLKDQDMIK